MSIFIDEQVSVSRMRALSAHYLERGSLAKPPRFSCGSLAKLLYII